MTRVLTIGIYLLVLVCPSRAHSQGLQTGVLRGTVTSTDGLSVPGATVTVKSPALQGLRTEVTDVNGVYTLRGLPPGAYALTIELSGMQTVTRDGVVIQLGGTAEINATMQVGGVQEAVTVIGESPSVVTTIHAGQNLTSAEVAAMPIGRTPFRMAELSPGLTSNTPNGGQVTISGSFAYDNVFMINGVDVNDNLFGTSNNLFIEDAVAETQVMTSGISAEYGRFSGGVINVITKSGGNKLSGSVRDNLSNSAWVKETPFEKSSNITHKSKLNKFYEGTVGGPIVLDRLWYFAAGRSEETTENRSLAQTGIGYDRIVSAKRGEAKVTGTLQPGQTLSGSFTKTTPATTAPAFDFSVDPGVILTSTNPNHLFVLNYNGVAKKFFGTLQYSEKTFGFRDSGGTSTAIIDSPFLTRGVAPGVPGTQHFNAPYFDATDPEDRNNKQVTGSLARTVSTKKAGSHDLKGGIEWYRSTRTGGNSQTATGYVFQSDYKLGSDGKPLLDSSNHPVPVFVPGVSRVQNWLPTRGAQINIKTSSFYFQDRWAVAPRVRVDAGLRYERVRSEATGDINSLNTNTIVPRLGSSFDLTGDGMNVLQVTYAHYAGKYSEAQFARNTNVGSPSLVVGSYSGSAGEGRNFAPGFDPANYSTVIAGNFPTANIFFADGLSSPVVKEVTASYGRLIGRRGYAKGTYVWRNTSNFVEDFITIDNGKTSIVRNGVNFGTFDNVVYRNSNVPKRDYQGVQFISNYRLAQDLHVAGNWTIQLKNEGNFEGENPNQPAISSSIGDYPEMLVENRNFPAGRLADYQRHKVRLWAIYRQSLGRLGAVDVSPIWRINSGQTYSLTAAGVPLSAIQLSRNPGYARLPGGNSQTLFFGDRGSQDFPGYAVVDFSATYSIPVWKAVKPWLKVEIYNVLNNDKLILWDRTVTPDSSSALDANGLPTGYIKGARFGQATRNAHFPQYIPGLDGLRTFQMAFGLRF